MLKKINKQGMGYGVWGWIVDYEAHDKGHVMRGIWYKIGKEKGHELRVMRYDSQAIFYRLGDAQFEVW